MSALAIHSGQRVGWWLGIGDAILSLVLYVAQVSIGLPGLPRLWHEPTRLLSVLLAVVFLLLAVRVLRRDPA